MNVDFIRAATLPLMIIGDWHAVAVFVLFVAPWVLFDEDGEVDLRQRPVAAEVGEPAAGARGRSGQVPPSGSAPQP